MMTIPQEKKKNCRQKTCCQHNRGVTTFFQGNVHCVVRNHMQDLETNETSEKKCFSTGHGTIFNTLSLVLQEFN